MARIKELLRSASRRGKQLEAGDTVMVVDDGGWSPVPPVINGAVLTVERRFNEHGVVIVGATGWWWDSRFIRISPWT